MECANGGEVSIQLSVYLRKLFDFTIIDIEMLPTKLPTNLIP